MKTGIIIQARLGSTRLPQKVLLDFYNGKSILKIITDRLSSILPIPLFVATTVNKADDDIENFCIENNIQVYRGDENDVLSRFINISDSFGFSHVIRVCADNPFIVANDIKRLYDALTDIPQCDYLSFRVEETPSILTHYGFWAELVSVKALKVVARSDEMIYHEHVTNYLYKNPESFNIQWLDVSQKVVKNRNIRLTVDTINDFINAQKIYCKSGEIFSAENIIDLILQDEELIESMTFQIKQNSK